MRNKNTTSKISRKKLVQRLTALDISTTAATEVDVDLAARLQSLSIASSLNTDARSSRYVHRAVSVVGRVGIVRLAALCVLVASLGLASVNGLPDPLQVAMSNVLKVVGINVPHPENEPIRMRQGIPDPSGSTTVVP